MNERLCFASEVYEPIVQHSTRAREQYPKYCLAKSKSITLIKQIAQNDPNVPQM